MSLRCFPSFMTNNRKHIGRWHTHLHSYLHSYFKTHTIQEHLPAETSQINQKNKFEDRLEAKSRLEMLFSVDRTRISFSALGFQAVPQTKESPRLKTTTRKYLKVSLYRHIELRARTRYTVKNRDRRTRQSAWQQKWNLSVNFPTIPTAKISLI
jgi:hypothetical protein